MIYTYTYFVDGIPEYVGKGTDARYLVHANCKLPTLFSRHVRKAKREQRDIRITLEPFSSDAEAFAEEARLVQQYGRRANGTGTLYNETEGGLGGSAHCGRKHSEATKAKMRGRKVSDENRQLLSAMNTGPNNPNYGKTQSAEWKEKRLSAIRGRKQSPEARQKMRDAWAAKRLAQQQIQ